MVVYGAYHRAGQLKETGPPGPLTVDYILRIIIMIIMIIVNSRILDRISIVFHRKFRIT